MLPVGSLAAGGGISTTGAGSDIGAAGVMAAFGFRGAAFFAGALFLAAALRCGAARFAVRLAAGFDRRFIAIFALPAFFFTLLLPAFRFFFIANSP